MGDDIVRVRVPMWNNTNSKGMPMILGFDKGLKQGIRGDKMNTEIGIKTRK